MCLFVSGLVNKRFGLNGICMEGYNVILEISNVICVVIFLVGYLWLL